MIYVKGTTFWHGVRVLGSSSIKTVCGRRLPSDSVIADMARADFLCRSCATIINRSGSVLT